MATQRHRHSSPARILSSGHRSHRSHGRGLRWLTLPHLVLATGTILISTGIYRSRFCAERPGPTWPLLAMHVPELECAVWCSIKASTAVNAIDGALVEGLDYRGHVLTVRYDPARSSPDQILESLRRRNFRVDRIPLDAAEANCGEIPTTNK